MNRSPNLDRISAEADVRFLIHGEMPKYTITPLQIGDGKKLAGD
jgi:hypothetical protein